MENKYNENGGIGAYDSNGTRAFIQTYTHNEVSIMYLDEHYNTKEEFIRIRIGTNEGKQIIMLENGKFYMIQGFASTVSYLDELSVEKIVQAISGIELIQEVIGNILALHTNSKTNLVQAINEVAQNASTPRHLAGYVQYATEGVDPEVEDMSIRYNDMSKRFEYFSDVDGWTLLPIGWQRLPHIVRSRDYLPSEPNDLDRYGILNEDKVVSYQNGEWTELCSLVDEVGDEYLVKEVHNKLFNGNATGSVILTDMGWTYLVHYNYL